MKHKSSIVGLVSVAVLMSACTSIKGSPGYRNNIKSAGFQRSNAVKELKPLPSVYHARCCAQPTRAASKQSAIKKTIM
ncbi:hypothetical protein [Thiothrix subterranea]|uniref:hypothetical protein n=1 Tax=Thiothrix subterranea TaxID=2735563 RepID=UPI00280AB432|nr:hypothetical protein [Thiothrix subterranea]